MGRTNAPPAVSGRDARESADLAEQPVALALFHDEHLRVGAQIGDESRRRLRLRVRELGPLGRGEQVGAELVAADGGRVRAPRRQRRRRRPPGHVLQPRDPLHPVVVTVPERAERPAGNEHPADLRHRPRHVEPVHRLPAEHRADRRVGQRDRLRRAGQRPRRRHLPPQLGQHRRVRLDRGHLRAQADQHRRQLPGAGLRSSTRSPASARPVGSTHQRTASARIDPPGAPHTPPRPPQTKTPAGPTHPCPCPPPFWLCWLVLMPQPPWWWRSRSCPRGGGRVPGSPDVPRGARSSESPPPAFRLSAPLAARDRQVPGGVHVPVKDQAAGVAPVGPLGQAQLGFHRAAARAGLRGGIPAVGGDQRPARSTVL